MTIALPDLPYLQNALEPVISSRTMHHHYEKHHASYVKKLEAALGSGDDRSLEDIILESYRNGDAAVFNPAAQVWNHNFYWNSMTPEPSVVDDPKLSELIESSFGGLDPLLQQLEDVAKKEFGCGWAWLVYDPKREQLRTISTTDAKNPLPSELAPLLTIDIWEHAYYLDYQHDRAAYIEGVLDKLLNWGFATANLQKALRG